MTDIEMGGHESPRRGPGTRRAEGPGARVTERSSGGGADRTGGRDAERTGGRGPDRTGGAERSGGGGAEPSDRSGQRAGREHAGLAAGKGPEHTPRRARPDGEALMRAAWAQGGHFTARQARRCGYGSALVRHHVRAGRFERVHHGVYRLRAHPRTPHDAIIAAWLAAGGAERSDVVATHESALHLLGLLAETPARVHLTTSRGLRRRAPPGVVLYTTNRLPSARETVVVSGVRATDAPRTIADMAARGLARPDAVALARAAFARGLADRPRLLAAIRARGGRSARLIRRTLMQDRFVRPGAPARLVTRPAESRRPGYT